MLLLEGLNVTWLPRFDQLFPFIEKARSYLHLGATRVVRYNLKNKSYKQKMVELSNILGSAAAHLCIANHSAFTNLLPEFDKLIGQMKKDGSLKVIFNKFQ